MEHVALFVAGLALLAAGTPLLVFGAARLDRRAGRDPFAVGAVGVAFGPCVAGLAFNLASVLRVVPMPRLALGTIVGANVAGIGLVLGAAALVRPVAATARVFSTALPALFVATLLFWFLASDKELSRIDGGVLLGGFVVTLVILARAARTESPEARAAFAVWVPERLSIRLAAVLALLGLSATVGGALLSAAHAIPAARDPRFTSPILGETLAGTVTGLPALGAALVAARRGRSDLVLALAVGPALANLLLVCGAVALVQPLGVPDAVIMNEVPALALVTLLLLPALLNGLRVPRWEGALLLAAYAACVAWQISRAMRR